MKALEIAYYLIALANEKGFKMNSLKLQKMLYLIQKEEIKNKRVAFEDKIEAWQYGPVVPEVYFRFAGYGPVPIILSISLNEIEIPENTKISVDKIFNEYIGQNVWEMESETNTPGNAWDKAYKRGYKAEITVNDIKNDIKKDIKNKKFLNLDKFGLHFCKKKIII